MYIYTYLHILYIHICIHTYSAHTYSTHYESLTCIKAKTTDAETAQWCPFLTVSGEEKETGHPRVPGADQDDCFVQKQFDTKPINGGSPNGWFSVNKWLVYTGKN